MKTPVACLAGVTIFVASFTSSLANQVTEMFECSELAQWAGRKQEAYQIALLGYERALVEASEAIERFTQLKTETPDFNSERSPDFWAGMWMGRSILAVTDWLQDQRPVRAREGAGATERVRTTLRRQQAWKPIAEDEFRQRGCEFYLRKGG